ncbi:MAG: DUF11 domain-containing protein [Anaerolineae bacterium]|nr:MAG: DUF11 domain-containing protein [Anaerolineae bacterium]
MLEIRPIEARRQLPIIALWVALALILRGPMAHAATIAVTSTADTVADDGQCTLREAITAANTDTASGDTAGECVAGSGDDAIDLTGVSGTIHLTGSLPEIISNIVFNGPGQNNLTVRRNTGGDYRICTIEVNAAVTISGLTLSSGRVVGDHGGGIYSAGTLTLSNSTVSANSAYLGGGIFNAPGGRLTLNGSTVSGNSAEQGGGIDNDQGVVELTNSVLSGNYATSGGGGMANLGSATLDNSTVSENLADYGGGAYNSGAMTVFSSTVSSNDASSDGGGISNSNAGVLALTNSAVINNTASRGGGVFNGPNSTVTLTHTTLSGNSADCGGGIYNEGRMDQFDSTVNNNEILIHGHGGGIFNAITGTLALSNSGVSSNRIHNADDSYGGGIYNAGALTLDNSAVSSNRTSYGDRCHGGGIYNGGSLTLNDSTVSGNNASDQASFGHGGGIYNVEGGSSVTLNNSTVSGNHSSKDGGDGGGLWNGGGATMILNNSTVSLNGSSNNGGGIYNSGGSTLNLNNCTIGNSNLADGSGGGIWNGNDGTVNIKNSIVAHNLSNADGPDCCNSATLISLDYNLVGDSSACPFAIQSGDQVDVDPLLSPLQDNGGSTETCALLLGSPAFDAVPIESCTDHQGTPIPTDQRGVSRPQGPACDMGAYEAQSADLGLSKTVDEVGPAVAETVVFAVQVTNNGPLAATGVIISDVLPLGLSYVSSLAGQGSYTSGTGEWDVGSLTAGLGVTLLLTATVDAGMEGSTITNTAAVAATDQFDSYVANDTAVASVLVEEPGPAEYRVYLPFTGLNYTPPITFPLYIGDAIAVRPVAYQGEVFYSTPVRMPHELPSGGRFYFSSQPDAVAEVLVDDELVVSLAGTEVLSYDFSTSGHPVPAILEVPRTTMEPWAGQTVTIVYRDVYAVCVEASTMWLIWSP